MKILGNLDFQSANYVNDAKLILAVETGYPASPTAGRVIFADKRVMICIEVVSGVPVWVPLTNEISSKIHTQTSASATWVVTHNFNTSSVVVQVLDADGKSIIPNDVDCSVANQVTISFNAAITGRAIVMLGNLSGVPKDNVMFTQTYTSSTTWVVSHGLGYNPIIRCYIGNYEVQPYSIVHNSTTQATVTFSAAQAGYVNCV